MRTPLTLLLAAMIAVGLAVPLAANGADEKLWIGRITCTWQIIEQWECTVENEYCSISCKRDVATPDIKADLEFTIEDGGWLNEEQVVFSVPTPEWWRVHEETSFQQKEKCCRPKTRRGQMESCENYMVRPGDYGEDKDKRTWAEFVEVSELGVGLSMDRSTRKAKIASSFTLHSTKFSTWSAGLLRDACSQEDDDALPVVHLTTEERHDDWTCEGYGIISRDGSRIDFSINQPEPEETTNFVPKDTPSVQLNTCLTAKGSCSCPDCRDCRTFENVKLATNLGIVSGELVRCDVRAQELRSQLLTQLGDCFTSRGLLPTCVPALVTCVQTNPDTAGACMWIHCPMDATGGERAEGEPLRSCIGAAINGWLANDPRCR